MLGRGLWPVVSKGLQHLSPSLHSLFLAYAGTILLYSGWGSVANWFDRKWATTRVG